MAKIGNLVQQQSTTTGTGNLTLTTVNGKRSFSTEFSTGVTPDVFYYFIANQSAAEWEHGTGHMSAASTLVRDTVISSSNANALVSFTAGTKDVVNDLPASIQTLLESTIGSGSIVRATNPTLVSPTLVSPALVSPALGTPSSGNLSNCTNYPSQAGLTQIATSTPSAVASVDFTSISASYNRLKIYWSGISCATANRQFLIKPSIGGTFGGTNILGQTSSLLLNTDALTSSLGADKINFLSLATFQTAAETCSGVLIIKDYASSIGYKSFEAFTRYRAGASQDRYYQSFGYFENTSAIDGLRCYWGTTAEAEQASNFDAGTITLYGSL